MSSQIVIVGRCINIERKDVSGGHTLVNVRVPVDYHSRGEKETTWWDVNIWGKSAESFLRYIKERDVVMFSGQPHVREYERSDGTKGFSPTVKSATWAFVPRASEDPRSAVHAEPLHHNPATSNGPINSESNVPF